MSRQSKAIMTQQCRAVFVGCDKYVRGPSGCGRALHVVKCDNIMWRRHHATDPYHEQRTYIYTGWPSYPSWNPSGRDEQLSTLSELSVSSLFIPYPHATPTRTSILHPRSPRSLSAISVATGSESKQNRQEYIHIYKRVRNQKPLPRPK